MRAILDKSLRRSNNLLKVSPKIRSSTDLGPELEMLNGLRDLKLSQASLPVVHLLSAQLRGRCSVIFVLEA